MVIPQKQLGEISARGLVDVLRHNPQKPPEVIDGQEAILALQMLLNSNLTRTIQNIPTFSCLDVDSVRSMAPGGIIVGLEGTLLDPDSPETEISQANQTVLQKLKKLGIPIHIHSRNRQNYPDMLPPGIPVAQNVPRKPDPRGFQAIASLGPFHSHQSHQTRPAPWIVIGHHPIADVAAARAAGMGAIWITEPLDKKSVAETASYTYGRWIKEWHDRRRAKSPAKKSR